MSCLPFLVRRARPLREVRVGVLDAHRLAGDEPVWPRRRRSQITEASPRWSGSPGGSGSTRSTRCVGARSVREIEVLDDGPQRLALAHHEDARASTLKA
jgi:hypothetical protein